MGKIPFFSIFFISIIFLGIYSIQIHCEPWQDKQALLDFLQSMSKSRYLDWSPITPVCTSWTGVTCNDEQTMVIYLRLPGYGFRGLIPNNTISRLTGLQILSLRNNMISGEFPSDFLKLRNLTTLYLQHNMFYGPLPLNFSVWEKLSVVSLANNEFNGSIPESISSLKNLSMLDLSRNSLSGRIPDIGSLNLRYLNLAYNHLNGTLPNSLRRFPDSAFLGNNVSFEALVPSLAPSLPPVKPPGGKIIPVESKKKLSETALLGIILGGCAILFVIIAVFLVVFCSNKARVKRAAMNRQKEETKSNALKKKRVAKESQEEKSGSITFFEGSKLAFNLEDLLRASAEVLGKGSFGTTYKAALEDGMTVVVKRLKEVSVGKRDFEQGMEVAGNIKHDNVVDLRAYFYSKDEKLVVYDYFSQGSLSTMLHGKRGENPIPLDWENRLNIVIGVAKGLSHIHAQTNGKLIHGNIKSSNIFLNTENQGCISDLGLATIITQLTPPTHRIRGYRAPELTDPKKPTQATDVYSFGVLVLELLTGKNPLTEGPPGLVRWVKSVVREEWTAEVFDVELLKFPNFEEEMVSMLQLGLTCTEERVPERRPKMWEVVRMVEDLRRGYSGTRPSSKGSTPAHVSNFGEIGSSSTSAPQ